MKIGDWRLPTSKTEDIYNALDPTVQRRLLKATKTYNQSSNEYVHDTENLTSLEANGEEDAESVTNSEADFDSSSDEDDEGEGCV